MNKFFHLYIIILFSAFLSHSYSQESYGKILFDGSEMMVKCLDNSILLCRKSYDQESNGFNLIKVDSNGSILWAKKYHLDTVGGPEKMTIVPLPDSSFICGGSSGSGVFLVKIDENGNSSWIKGFNLMNAWSLIKAAYENGYIYGVGDCSHNFYHDGFFIVKFDTLGNLLSYKTFLTNLHNTTHDFIIDNRHNLIITGNNWFWDTAFVAVVDSQLNLKFTKTYSHGEDGFYSNCIKQSQNGEYILGGCVWTIMTTNRLLGSILRLDSTGTIISSRIYDNPDIPFGYQFKHLAMTVSDEIWIATGIDTQNESFATLIKTNISGDTLKSCHYLGSDPDDIIVTDGNPVLLMHPYPHFQNNYSAIVKTVNDGFYECNKINKVITVADDPLFQSNSINLPTINDPYSLLEPIITDSLIDFVELDYCLYNSFEDIEQEDKAAITVYPNPFSDNLNIILNTNEKSEITIYNITSRKLLQQQFTNSYSVKTEHLAKGIYIYLVKCEGGMCKKGKVVKN